MPSTFGTTLRVTIFGQSHSAAIGCVMEGLPSGLRVDPAALARFMARRAPGQGDWSTPRKEADEPRFLSGLNPDGVTCGAPLALEIANADTRPGDYADFLTIPRPGHADLTAWAKWHGNHDPRGGGHFSGRLTAPLCAAGAIALQVLEKRGVTIAAHLLSVADVDDVPFSAPTGSADPVGSLDAQIEGLKDRWGQGLPTIDEVAGRHMLAAIAAARREGDSVGGVIECVACGLPAGIGSPMFDGMESLIAHIVFGIPAVKGIEFGLGFGAARLRGSQNNDPYRMVGGRVCPTTNNAGGILGGITTGLPLLFRMAVKPTPSVAKAQESVDLASMRDVMLTVRGRHDPCIAPRAVPVAEAAAALATLDAWLSFPPDDMTSRGDASHSDDPVR